MDTHLNYWEAAMVNKNIDLASLGVQTDNPLILGVETQP